MRVVFPFDDVLFEILMIGPSSRGRDRGGDESQGRRPSTLPPLWVTSGVSRTREDLRAACSRHGPARRSVGWLTCLPKSGMYLLTRQPEPALSATGAH